MSARRGKKSPVEIRRERTRKNLTVSAGRPRLSVFRSSRHVYAQIIDDTAAKTLVAVSTRSKELKGTLKKTADTAAAKVVGKLLAQKAKEQNISQVCFDRGAYLYHGRVKALADAAREEGLKF